MSIDWPLCQAARIVRAGGIIAYPTESVYGLGCDPYNQNAVANLLKIKQRSANKGFIIIAANLQQLTDFIQLNQTLRHRILAPTPKPTTWLVPAKPNIAPWLRGQHTTIAIRITAHPIAHQLCLTLKQAIVSTSANLSGYPAAKTKMALDMQLLPHIDFVISGRVGGLTRPTEIRDAHNNKCIRY